MGRIGKTLALILTLIIAMSCLTLLTINPTNAQTIPKPSVPEFSLQLIGPAYVVPTTYHLDQNTGQIVADIGYTNEYSAVVITTKNQPYDTTYGSLFYNIRLKNHEWNDTWLYPLDNLFRMFQTYPTQSTESGYTNITLTIQSNSLLVGVLNDIQVEAMLGNIGRHQEYSDTGQYLGAPYVFNGQTSDWSSTQSINIPANVPLDSISPNPTSPITSTPTTSMPTSTPTTPNTNVDSITLPLNVFIALVAILVVVILALLILALKKHQKTVT
jgi:hypothetical protein